MILSEYNFNEVNNSVSPNLILRQHGLLSTRRIEEKDYIDYEFSKAFAMVDHQIAHIYIKPGYEDEVKSIFKNEAMEHEKGYFLACGALVQKRLSDIDF